MLKTVNRLAEETSPYLLQHAHNPVDWYPWGAEALQKAKAQDMPILVSIGYSACHWCHVMERESFEDEETAELMNKYFINIKIDREERPDLDHIYMDAVQAISGQGGWPLNVFLTPECKPFYGGTYFPPVNAFNRASWKEVLAGVRQLYIEKRQEVEAQAEELTRHIGQGVPGSVKNFLVSDSPGLFTWQQANQVFANIMKQADKTGGGFGSAPKFPQTFIIKYLLRYYHYAKNEDALRQACLSLEKMIYGGMYDQAGGGFARYSTDNAWLVPHFEKMLYDNALLISVLCDAYQLTGDQLYRQTVEHTVDFITRELMNAQGAFYSALDADSEGHEGKYYVWSFKEINEILGPDSGLFCEFYDVTPGGNWEHTNILHVPVPAATFARQKNLTVDSLESMLKTCMSKLLNVRDKRIRPQLDDKILLGWNALMNISLSKASAAFGEKKYIEIAVKNFSFLWKNFYGQAGAGLLHTYKNGTAKFPAFLDDYAYLIEACIWLQEVTSDVSYLRHAIMLADMVLENFNGEDGYFYYTGRSQEDIIVRKQEIYDGAVPSGNSVMAANLFYLSIISDNRHFKEKAVKMITGLVELLVKYPSSFANWGCVFIDQLAGMNEIAIVGKEFDRLRDRLLGKFIPNRVLQSIESGEAAAEFPLLKNKTAVSQPLIYLCRNYTCQSPNNDINLVLDRIAENNTISANNN